MPLQATSGAASYDAFGGGVPVVPAYIEEVFSAFVYAGSDSAQTLTDGIDRTKGALDWFKVRSVAGENHILWDTVRSGGLETNTTSSEATVGRDKATYITQNNGNVVLNFGGNTVFNRAARDYVKWTFRKQPKFFDIVTWTGDGVTTGRTIAHSLNSAVGAVFVKCTSNPSDWPMWHNTFTSLQGMYLNTTGSKTVNTFESKFGNGTTVVAPTSTVFTVGIDNNVSGRTYVAYLFAHDAGGFGLTGTDNVISCGTFTTDGSGNATVSLGYEPQWVMIKTSTSVDSWRMYDVMRGMPVKNSATNLNANTTAAETLGYEITPTPTGFIFGIEASKTYIYIAIRRGPMKVPTTGTSVFSPIAVNAMQGTQQTTNFPVDMQLIANRGGETRNFSAVDRLRGVSTNTTSTYRGNITSSTAAESTSVVFATQNWNSTGFQISANTAETTALFYSFKRAPSFMDVVCYTGTGANATQTHNLAAVPELIIVKNRSLAVTWPVYSSALGGTDYLRLNLSNGTSVNSTIWNNTNPTSSVFTVGTSSLSNGSGDNYVAYLFATVLGVSKVGSYVGAGLGTPKQIDCGFTSGARFVLIKDTTGNDWYVWDSARGIVAGNDPYLFLNTTAAEVTSTDYVDTYSAGFELTATAPNSLNDSARTYIFLAIA